MFETGDMVVLTIGKRQLSKHNVPKHLRKQVLEVVAVSDDEVRVQDPDSAGFVSLPVSIVKLLPRSPSQIRLGAAENVATAALNVFRAELRACLSKKDFALVDERLRGLSFVYSAEVQQMIIQADKSAGWDPTAEVDE